MALAWPLAATPGAAAATPQTWTYTEGDPGLAGGVGVPFMLERLADQTLGTGMTVTTDANGLENITFVLDQQTVDSVAPATEVTDTPSTLPHDLPLSGVSGTVKTFYDLGGTIDLGGNRGVSVSLYYNVGDGSDPVSSWQLAGVATDGAFDFALSGEPSGTTIAYQVRLTAPAAVMATPVVISDITITYGAHATPTPTPKPTHKPTHKPSPTPTSSGSGSSGHSGNDNASGAPPTGNGNGTGAGNGSGSGNVSAGAAHPSSATTHHSVSHSTTNVALPRSSASSAAGIVSGYVLSAPVAVALSSPAGDSAVTGSAAHKSGGHAEGGGADTPRDLGYAALGACALLAIAAPWPLASRRLRALVVFEHDRQAAFSQTQEWLDEPRGRV